MSSALALGAVSAVLRNILDNGLVDAPLAVGAPVKVTAVAPDVVKLDDPQAPPQLNLFLYRVSPNLGWRNAALPSRDDAGNRVTNPPLALNLHYLLTAYGRADLQAEILLGYGMHLLHERPFLDRATIRKALAQSPPPVDPMILPEAFRDPPAAGLADQLETLKVTFEAMDTEELSRLWSATQAHYRPSAAYQVSVVLIEATGPAVSPLPVLSRAVAAAPGLVPAYPTIEAVEPPPGQEAAELGDTATLRGHHLDGTQVAVSFVHRLLDGPHVVSVGTVTDPGRIDVPLPPSGSQVDADWPVGVWSVTARLIRPGEFEPRQTNTAAMLLAPTVSIAASDLSRDATTGAVTANATVHPLVRPEQPAVLALGTAEASAPPRSAPTGSLQFVLDGVPPGKAWIRLRVDGVVSHLVNTAADPPAYESGASVVVPS